ncbi:nuclear intron maturase 4, mitochondrial isoform X2 [Elaeis guineensis]|uniref:Nuclear intron maturase 4, mitochondrial isoform X2 n=1 Tax=Elaeis guineensis var. tenera TaxID=51953 RepID=A0A8N4EYZ9_ELAGV|nr:nuclear intron maturase 4, mitochondrial isoform X2 [Elaeis guineensis]
MPSFEHWRFCATNFLLEEAEDVGESMNQLRKRSTAPISLAKSLACLPDESPTPEKRKPLTRMELKRLMEVRIKKRVKAQYLNGKFYDLMGSVIATADTLQDSYDTIRLNSNVDLASKRDDICFNSLAEELASGNFDVEANTSMMVAKGGCKECLVLPKLKLKVIQEAIRVVLEVVYRPHFSKISHGCRSGRGHRSALRYVCKEIGKPDWWFTVSLNKEADGNILSKLVSEMEEKIEDARLFSFIHRMFDARVLNLVFGSFPKGQGLPQEGVLSPILMNIYLDSFDHEVFRICMRYEGVGSDSADVKNGQRSKLRCWFRRQMKDCDNRNADQSTDAVETRLHACRYMDEILIAVYGSKDVALRIKDEIITCLRNSLYLNVEDRGDLFPVRKNSRGLQFLGVTVRVAAKETAALRAVHKLKDKIRLFASQKQEIWDAMTLRIGKKWLAYGLRRIKESEIKSLGLSTPVLDHISQFRKEGMKTDHWFKHLLKIWMEDVNAKVEANENIILSKYIAEPALPEDLRDSFHKFQKQAMEYVSSETASTLALMQSSTTNTKPISGTETTVLRTEASINFIKRSLYRYGLINVEGFPRHVSTLVLQDDALIISWFSGLVRRWLKWYSEFDNFGDIKHMMVECARKSCIRTLAAKYRMHEVLIEKRFELDQSGIPTTEDLETEMMASDFPISDDDEALMYGISSSGLCILSLSRVKVPTRIFNCFVMGCTTASPSMYTLHVKEKQRFPGWKTGFSTSIHSSLNRRRIGLCSQHVKDLYMGYISLQSIEFGALSR